jgi:hypothetical protein
VSRIRRPLSPRLGTALVIGAVVTIALAGFATTHVAPSASQLATSSDLPSVSATAQAAAGTSTVGDGPADDAGDTHGVGQPAGTGASAEPLAAGGPGSTPSPSATRPAAESDEALAAGIAPFPESPVADYQVGGAYDPAPGVNLVVRTAKAFPEHGLYNVCSVNGFQTQRADVDFWLSNNRDLLLWDASGAPLADPEAPGEYILDISTSAKRGRIAEIQTRELRDCAARGFQAIELDNLDSYKKSAGAFDLGAASAFAALLTAKAHALGMPIGQKNTPELGWAGSDEIGFDFAVAEDCLADQNCSAYTDVYGTRVIGLEYTDRTTDFAAVCADPRRPSSTLLRDRALRIPGTPGYAAERCTTEPTALSG